MYGVHSAFIGCYLQFLYNSFSSSIPFCHVLTKSYFMVPILTLSLLFSIDGKRRIAMQKLWDEAKDAVSFDQLVDLALHFSNRKRGESEVVITYIDEDGDVITISSDEELEDAFSQFLNKSPPVVHATAKFKKATEEMLNVRVEADNTLSARPTDSNMKKFLQLKKELLEKKKAMKESKSGEKATQTAQPEMRDTHTQVVDVPAPKKPVAAQEKTMDESLECFDKHFIHGRHTCDGCYVSPILGIRYHATNLPDYDLCQGCFQKYKGDEIIFQPEELDRDKHLQRRWQMRKLRSEREAEYQKRSQGHRNTTQAVQPHQLVREVASNFCDSALKEAIKRSLEMQQKKSMESNTTEVCDKADICSTSESNIGPEKKESVVVEDASVESSHQKDTATSKDPPSTLTDEIIAMLAPVNMSSDKKDSVVVEDASEEKPSHQKDTATSKDAPSTLAELLIPVAPTHPPVSVNEPVAVPIGEAASSHSGQSILDGEEEIEIKSDGSNEWEVVNNNGNVDDQVVAQAAQMLGSALFQSDMSNHVHVNEEESITSGLTSVPSIKTKSKPEISSVLLSRYDNELKQLHSFGFLDDHKNIDALERLEASYIGVDSDEKVSLGMVVDLLLKENESSASA